tara:strand:+ start:429 stop:665 length:237 start_codon:yes stop_codon:yes gene_type:complete
MDYNNNDIDKIVQFKTWTDKKKIDELLRIDAAMYCALGTDSTTAERRGVKRKSQEIYRAIRKVHKPTGDLFLMDVDRI